MNFFPAALSQQLPPERRCIALNKKSSRSAAFGSFVSFVSVVEKSDACECHCDVVLVAGLDNVVVTDRTARLCNVLNA